VATQGTPPVKKVDALLKSLLILSRTVDYALEREAVKAVVSERLSGSKVQILRLLGTHPSYTSSQIAHFLCVSKPAVTQLVDSMVGSKLLVRRTAKHDRREVDLRLTEKGQSAFQSIRREQRRLLRDSVKHAGGASVERWIKTLNQATSALVQSVGAFDVFCLQCGAHEDDTCMLTNGDVECPFKRVENSRSALKARTKASRKTATRNARAK